MSYESISRLSQLTGMTRETVAKRLVDLTPTIDGKAKTYESKEALQLLYGAGVKGDYDLQAERARLAHHQANLESLKQATEERRLIPTEFVILTCSEIVSLTRSKLLGLHNQVKTNNPGLDQKIVNDIEKLIHEALTELGSEGMPPKLIKWIESHHGSKHANING